MQKGLEMMLACHISINHWNFRHYLPKVSPIYHPKIIHAYFSKGYEGVLSNRPGPLVLLDIGQHIA